MCQFHCKRCIDVCPTGALRSMKLAEKRRTRIGMAELFLEKCIPYIEGTDCGACAEQCPTGAMHMVTDSRGVRIPALRPGLCIGCGGCENACPVQPKPAVIVHPVQTQVQADDPRKYRLTGPNAGPAGDEWLF
ncbi:MAG: 4Fe-4S dicluster domain-containing protein [Alphaproteobacteria bacterium]|nr:4Fe-4S dicluster domain-containing protein [Alphaproteobacteria bacterium]